MQAVQASPGRAHPCEVSEGSVLARADPLRAEVLGLPGLFHSLAERGVFEEEGKRFHWALHADSIRFGDDCMTVRLDSGTGHAQSRPCAGPRSVRDCYLQIGRREKRRMGLRISRQACASVWGSHRAPERARKRASAGQARTPNPEGLSAWGTI